MMHAFTVKRRNKKTMTCTNYKCYNLNRAISCTNYKGIKITRRSYSELKQATLLRDERRPKIGISDFGGFFKKKR